MLVAAVLCHMFLVSGYAGGAPRGAATVQDRFLPAAEQSDLFHGVVGERMRINFEKRLLTLDLDSILKPYTHRPGVQKWAGEYIGKYLHAGVLVWRQTGDARLKTRLDYAARVLMDAQLPDGYLGTYLEKDRWVLEPKSWEVWAHKYNLVGLLAYYDATGDSRALDVCRRMGDLLCSVFGDGRKDIVRSGSHVGMAATSVLEPMVALYRRTGDKKYLEFCLYITRAWEQPHGPRLISSLTRDGNVFRTANGKTYEMMSCLVGLIELYRVTGTPDYLKACTNAWNDIRLYRNYVIGTSSKGEHFQDDGVLSLGDNTGHGCTTVTWEQMSWHLFRLTGDPVYAQELERTIYNALLGAQSPRNGTVNYFTTLTERKKYGEYHQGILPDICCCSLSVPRGIALIPLCSAGTEDGAPAVVLYHPGHYTVTADKQPVTLTVTGNYPVEGDVGIKVGVSQRSRFPLRLRVPEWCSSFEAEIDGRKVIGKPGEWLNVERQWRDGDTLAVRMAMPLFTERHSARLPELVAVKRGPQVLAQDFSLGPSDKLPPEWVGSQIYPVKWTGTGEVSRVTLVPFMDASQNGTAYRVLFDRCDIDVPSGGRLTRPLGIPRGK